MDNWKLLLGIAVGTELLVTFEILTLMPKESSFLFLGFDIF